MASDDLIQFDVIESQKENIQALPSGRSAKKLAELFSASPVPQMQSNSQQQTATPANPSDTKAINDSIRAEFEAEIANLADADDPLDVFDRYVRWTLDAYPSAQATRQSQLHLLLERATKQFVAAPQYRNDPRYLRLWLHYAHLFADAPRETFVFLARHGIADALALFYEEYAEWLERAGRWVQAEEVYKLGIEREARPTQRLLRKLGEFERRRAEKAGAETEEPASPALPSVRPALAAKIDPFSAAVEAARDPQAPRPSNGVGRPQAGRLAKAKMAIFADTDSAAAPPALAAREPDSKGWDNIGSLAERKKENVMAPKPMAGETLKAGGKKSGAAKMTVFRDAMQVTVAQNGKKERVFVDLRTVYPTPDEPGTELSFEEVWAAARGWLEQSWNEEQEQEEGRKGRKMSGDDNRAEPSLVADENRLSLPHRPLKKESPRQKMTVHHDVVRLDENGAPICPKAGKPKKKKVMEVNETQTIKAKLDSPSGPKIRRRQSAEPTMTMHTKAATDDIYDIFNAPLKPSGQTDGEFDEHDEYGTDDYTSGAESTCTTKNLSVSEPGDAEMTDVPEEDPEDDGRAEEDESEISEARSVSEWSEFSTRKHVPQVDEERPNEPNDTQMSDLIDIQAHETPASSCDVGDQGELDHGQGHVEEGEEGEAQDLITLVIEHYPPRTRTVFIPIPPEDYVPPMRPYRDPAEVANNRLPFMTPITERTETSLGLPSQEDEEEEFSVITPSKCDETGVEAGEEGEAKDLEPLSSPLREVLSDKTPKDKIAQRLLQKPAPSTQPKSTSKTGAGKPIPPKGPIIKDAQCNPADDSVRNEILEKMHPPLSSYDGFHDHRDEDFGKGGEIRKFVKLASKGSRNSTDKTGTPATAFVLRFPDSTTRYTIRKELGAGAFAPVYLVENSAPDDHNAGEGDDANSPTAMMGRGAFAMPHHRRSAVEALKMEESPSAWEFHMMRLAHSRVGPHDRAAASLSPALELHLYRDECFLLLPFFPHGTLLDVVNMFRSESAGLMDECLAMFFTIEVLRTVEALHTRGVMHGDLKVDNCLLRVPVSPQQSHHHQGRLSLDGGAGGQVPLDSQYHASGEGGWAARGVTLIDFGRAIDVRAFVPDVQFIADWEMSAHDCAEMREGRPWTWQIDYHGIAGIVHCLLFGRYIETVRCDAGGGLGRNVAAGVGGGSGGRRYRIRESLKRYWQTEIWADCFDVLLNPGAFAEAEEGGAMPVLKSTRRVRERMEQWLEANCERGVGLRSLMAKVENWARGRK